MSEPHNPGVLYIVATPIGNLEDITYRAVRILKEADLIACEDTRQTRKLLDHYAIDKPMISYHEHNEGQRSQELIAKLESGATIAQVSDAGMPGISDPGYRVVQLALEHGITVVPIPGASAVIAALAASGLPTDAFEFRGFLPAKAGQRRTALEEVRSVPHTVIFYEAPHRILESLEDVVRTLGLQRPVVIARELTKIHEEFIRGTAQQVLDIVRGRELKGEITLLIGKSESPESPGESQDLRTRLEQLIREQKLDEKSALKVLAKETGQSKSEVYRELQRQKPHR
ncbi:MAG TPA: 16S rRNA (cytidine(1402)-2'-O)-methyltransferase [Candidatus Angelobacter sp.]|nr:16S rRNA (cytidine(1402)-2'-O)-methyltransferase [Candidatus Angelobacter sp.]